VTRLHTRIEELERRLGDCPACKPTIELVDNYRPRPRPPAVDCPVCGQPREWITVLVSFDPEAAER
jgi:hypothetical protein